MPKECPSCGCHAVGAKKIEGFLVEECEICGWLEGPSDAISEIEDIRMAKELNIDLAVWPLVKILNRAPDVKTCSSCGGHAGPSDPRPLPPYVQFDITSHTHRTLEKLMTSLNMGNRKTQARWIIEVNMSNRLMFTLRPVFRVGTADLSIDEISKAQSDVSIIAEQFSRDLNLGFWQR